MWWRKKKPEPDLCRTSCLHCPWYSATREDPEEAVQDFHTHMTHSHTGGTK